MGLYINPNYDKDIYKNDNDLTERNQEFFIKNHTAEMIEEQKKINDSLNQSLHGLKNLYQEHEYRQSSKWKEFSTQLNELQVASEKHDLLENQVIEQLKKLEADNESLDEMVQNNQFSNQQVIDELNRLVISQQGMEKQLDIYSGINKELKEKIQGQIDFQNQISEQLEAQGQSQEGMLKRLDNQEALTEKITRQLEHFRAILFERTSYLSDKIDDVSSYVMKLVSKDPFQSSIVLKEKENIHK